MISREAARAIYTARPFRPVQTRRVEPTGLEIELAETILRLYEFVDEVDDIHNHWDGGHGLGPARDEIGTALFHIRYGPDPEET